MRKNKILKKLMCFVCVSVDKHPCRRVFREAINTRKKYFLSLLSV